MLTLGIKFGKEVGHILSPESSVTPGTNAVCPYYALVAPPPQRITMDVEKPGYFSYCQHAVRLTVSYQVFHFLLF
jgi:hypothetical protein